MFVRVSRNGKESAIDIADKVKEYVENSGERFAEGIKLYTWDDKSISMREVGNISILSSSRIDSSIYCAWFIFKT